MQDENVNVVRLSWFRLLWYALRGLPFYLKPVGVKWHRIQTPLFPIMSCLMSTVIPAVLVCWRDFGQPEQDVGLGPYITYSVAACGIYAWLPFAISVLLFIWCLLVLAVLKSAIGESFRVVRGAQRVTYISAPFQMLFYVTVLLTPVDNIAWPFIGCVVGIVRVASVFECMRRESHGSLVAATLGTVACIDVWYVSMISSV